MKMHVKDVEADSGIKVCPSHPHGLVLNDDPPCFKVAEHSVLHMLFSLHCLHDSMCTNIAKKTWC